MLKMAVLVSGGGTNLQAIIDSIVNGTITNAEISVVISNNANAYALERAKKHGIEARCISPKQYETREAFNEALLAAIQSYDVDLVVLAGCLVVIPEIMVKAFELVRLGEEDVKKKFPAMYNAFCYGAPPHAGIAPGVDRMVMLLAGESSIREIIPFPMNKNAQDIMMGAPSVVEQKQLDELHIAIVGEVEKDD